MSHTINMLAKRNIQKYKKHYLIVLIVLLIVSTFIFSSFFIVDNLYQMKKNYHISTYGSWYTRIENIDEQTQKGIEIYSKDYFKDIIKYGYVDFQGKYDNYQIGHIEKDIYSLCRVKIIKGRKIQNDQEILINQKVSKKYKLYDQIEIEGKIFCFTGSSEKASRKEIAANIQKHGGVFTPSVTQKTDYLIVGNEGNPCWAFSCYGRKVEKAVGLRKKGINIQIVNEDDFWNALAL